MLNRCRLMLGASSTLLLLAPWQIAKGARIGRDVRMVALPKNMRVTLEYDTPLNFKYFFVRSSQPL